MGLDEPQLALGEASVGPELDHDVEAVAVDGGLARQQHGAAEAAVARSEVLHEHVEQGHQLAVAVVTDEPLEAGCCGQQAVTVGGLVGIDAVADVDGAIAEVRLDTVRVRHGLSFSSILAGKPSAAADVSIPKIRNEVSRLPDVAGKQLISYHPICQKTKVFPKTRILHSTIITLFILVCQLLLSPFTARQHDYTFVEQTERYGRG